MCPCHCITLIDRRFTPISIGQEHSTPLAMNKPWPPVTTCSDCHQYFADTYCCGRSNLSFAPRFPCHQTRVIYTDGATSNNGYTDAKSGIGMTMRNDPRQHNHAFPVDHGLDGNNRRTSQRAELLAILISLHLLQRTEDGARNHVGPQFSPRQPQDWLILSDSQYAILGLTSRFVENEKRDGRNKLGRPVANWDLFTEIIGIVRKEEAKGKLVGFAWIPREMNVRADQLAKLGKDMD